MQRTESLKYTNSGEEPITKGYVNIFKKWNDHDEADSNKEEAMKRGFYEAEIK